MKRLLVALAALCLLVLSTTGIVLVVRNQQRQAATRRFIDAGPASLAREEAAARQEGIPLTAQQLQRPLPPPAQNAAPLYTKLTKLLHDKPLGLPKYAEGMDAFHSYTPAQIAAVRRTLAARQDVMTLVHQAADKPQCVFARDWSKGAKLEFPEYQPMREAARLIKTESYLLARDGHYQEAVTNQARGFRVAEHAASDPALISYLVGVASEAITLSGMQSILILAGPDAAVDAGVQQTVAARHSRLSLRRAMAGEAGFYSAFFVRMHRGEKDGVSAAFAAGGFPDETARIVRPSAEERHNLHNLIDAWEADYLMRMRPLVVASDQPPPARHTAYTLVDEQVKRDSDDPASITHIFTDILLPVLGKIDQNDTRTRAREAVTVAAATILAARTKTGAFPNKLPPGFADPFTDRPLLYRREGAGFIIYSAGPTGRFDGGKPGEKVSGQESLFRYPTVPLPPV